MVFQSNDFSEFSKRLVNSYLFGKTTNISSNLGFLKKHSQIDVKTTFEILTPLSSKQKKTTYISNFKSQL
jgi:hypothetical protein